MKMKTKDNIEEIILNNLKELNDFEPNDGHFERFEAKLKAEQKKKRFSLNTLLKVAAAVVFAMLAVNQAFIYFSPAKHGFFQSAETNPTISLASLSPEYREVEFYYANAIGSGLEQWNTFKSEGLISQSEQEMMNTELADFEARFKNLQTDLATNPNDERVINAMIEYYQAKLDIINLIVGKLQEVKHRNNTNHETNI